MSKKYKFSEDSLLKHAAIGQKFKINNTDCEIICSGKPRSKAGEPKTDIYIQYQNLESKEIHELKISYKQTNADFVENKISSLRAEQIFGRTWFYRIAESLEPLSEKFNTNRLIYKSGKGKTERGSFTLGWKFELLNKKSGFLSGEISLTPEEIINIYSGITLEESKRHAMINQKIIDNSGVATHILHKDIASITSLQSMIDNLATIESYVYQTRMNKIYFACKALNFRSYSLKYDGDRPLAVYVNWTTVNNKLSSELIINNPLRKSGNEIAKLLLQSLTNLNIKNTDDITPDNVINYSEIVYE